MTKYGRKQDEELYDRYGIVKCNRKNQDVFWKGRLLFRTISSMLYNIYNQSLW